MCDRLVAVPVCPSPNSHKRLVIAPVDWSVNCTVSGAVPEVGEPVKSATMFRGVKSISKAIPNGVGLVPKSIIRSSMFEPSRSARLIFSNPKLNAPLTASVQYIFSPVTSTAISLARNGSDDVNCQAG